MWLIYRVHIRRSDISTMQQTSIASPGRPVSLGSTISVEGKMEHRNSTHTVQAAVMIIVAIVVVSVSLIPNKPGRTDGVGITAGAHGETGPFVLAQYNPCPNGKCR
jgi:hypothetical protein